ncbi:MAG TPA: hypothetical protein VIJ96_01165 [Acidothermaceae bacterium]
MVLIAESAEGGWGINGPANISADIIPAARRQLTGQQRAVPARPTSWVESSRRNV